MTSKTMPVPAPEGTFWCLEETPACDEYGGRYYELVLFPRSVEDRGMWDRAGMGLVRSSVPRERPQEIRRISARMVKTYRKTLSEQAGTDIITHFNKKMRYGA